DINWLLKGVKNSVELKNFAEKKGMKLYQLALKFILKNDKVSSVIPNISSLSDLNKYTNMDNLPDLTEDDLNYIESYYKKHYIELNEESIKETLRYK
ncbi:aldo/keto reductase, partial [Sulfolobus sp. E3]